VLHRDELQDAPIESESSFQPVSMKRSGQSTQVQSVGRCTAHELLTPIVTMPRRERCDRSIDAQKVC